ncbi:unnamed protein product [Malus baccata var. baccata]
MAPIAVGDVILDGTLAYFDEEDKVQSVNIHSLAALKKVILFGVPGAFTPTCSLKHVPGIIEKTEELKSKGVEKILCLSGITSHLTVFSVDFSLLAAIMASHLVEVFKVNSLNLLFSSVDHGLLWAKTYPENKDVLFLADGSAKYTHDLGLELDLSEKGLGTRSKRFALLIEDLKVKAANIESGGQFTISSADDILKAL